MLPNCHQHMSIHHFVELSPDPGATSKQKKRKKDKKSVSKISATCTRSVSAISSFPPLRAEENWKIDFTADGSGGKAAIANFLLSQRRKTGKSSLPPVRAAVKLKLPAFLLSQRRKAGKCEFAAHASGGKAA